MLLQGILRRDQVAEVHRVKTAAHQTYFHAPFLSVSPPRGKDRFARGISILTPSMQSANVPSPALVVEW